MATIKNPLTLISGGGQYETGAFTMPSGTYQTFSVQCGFEPDFIIVYANTMASGYCGAMASKEIVGNGYVLSYNGTTLTNGGFSNRITLVGDTFTVARAATFVTGTYTYKAYKGG